MNYAKVIGAAIQLFPKKILVTLIDANNGNKLSKHKMSAEMLPIAFNRPTILEIDNAQWRVLNADPVTADDYLYSRKLTLQVQSVVNGEGKIAAFDTPTASNELPVIGDAPLYADFAVELKTAEWRQIEFIRVEQLKRLEDAIQSIETILNGQPNPLLGYKRQYLRDDGELGGLGIPWVDFCSLLANPSYGTVLLNNDGPVRDSFVIRSDNYTYYGIMDNNLIRSLGITAFDSADDEFMQVLSKFGLLLVDWCNARMISAEINTEPLKEFIDI